MEPDRRSRISDLYHAALGRPGGERSAFLKEACAGDGALRQEVESLLGYESDSARFLEAPVADAIAGALGGVQGTPRMVGRQLGSYTILALLGTGGMGEVYRAHDRKLGRDVAIKIVPHLTADAERRARFAREARVLATLNHPHIGAIYGLEETDGVAALVLELVEGPTLAQRLARGRLPLSEALAIARQVAGALDAAHEKGIVHRDLKPANIVLQEAVNALGVPSGGAHAKVLDFGIAKTMAVGLAVDMTQRPSGSLAATAEGRILGTPAYMSPEQSRGLAVDKRTDIWAFGCVLFEMLAGRPAFAGDTMSDMFVAILEREPDWAVLPAETPGSLRTLLDRCLRKEPGNRLHDIADARIEVEEAARPNSVPVRGGINRRERLLWTAACATLLVLALARGLFFGRADDALRVPAGVTRFTIQMPGSRLRGGGFAAFALSPDGGHLVFSARPTADGVVQLWMRSNATELSQPVPGSEGGDHPAWAPDSRSVAFFAGGKLRKTSLAGGPATDICDVPDIIGATWGTRNEIVFGTQDGLQLVSAGGSGQPAQVSKVDRTRGELLHGWPQFLPDGRHVLFTSRGTRTEIRVLSLDTRQTVTLVEDGSRASYASGYLLFVRDTSLVAQPFDPSTLRLGPGVISLSARLPTSQFEIPSDLYASFSASANGMLVFAEEESPGISRLTWIDGRSGKPVGTVGDPAEYTFMSLSPDERRVAFVLGADWAFKRDNAIWLADVGPGTVTRLTSAPGNYSLPAWSPSGERLAYNASRGSEQQLIVRGALTSAPEDVIARSSLGHWASAWLRDESALLVTAGIGSGQTLGRVALSGDRKPADLFTEPIRGAAPVLSPDGRWIAYHTRTGGRPEVYVRPFPVTTNEVHQVSRNGGLNAKWRPRDSSQLFYVGADGMMMSARIDTSKGFDVRDHKLFALPQGRVTSGWFQQYDVSKDGRFLVIVADPQLTALMSEHITAVLNWPALLQSR